MAGMHRDKCGSSAVAAFMKVVDELKPANVQVVGAMAMVRNSVGSDAYVSDEIITSRAGVRVRIGNTVMLIISIFFLEVHCCNHVSNVFVGR